MRQSLKKTKEDIVKILTQQLLLTTKSSGSQLSFKFLFSNKVKTKDIP